MKKFYLIAIIVLCFLYSLNAQDSIQPKKIYNTWISLNSAPFNIKAVLYETKDSSISVSSSVVKQDYSTGNFEISNLHINEIETIKIRRKGSVGRGVWIGALAGCALGGIIGLASGDDPPGIMSFSAEDKAILGGFTGTFFGGGIGAIMGIIKVEIPINGSISNYNNQKNKLRKYSIKK